MNATLKTTLAWLALAGLVACSGANPGSTLPAGGSSQQPQAAQARPHVPHLLQSIVGVGDSLTAGYQSNGFLGQSNVRDPIDPGVIIPPNQENGWWADLYEQASGIPIAKAVEQMYDPTLSPLPLIKGPGLNNQIVPAPPPAPFGNSKTGDTCMGYGAFNYKGYQLSGLSAVRMNPASTNIRDMGVPGITLHEANVLYEPQTNTCEQLSGVPGLLNEVIAGESSTFWPVLGNFAYMGTNLSEVRAATSKHPTLATVWLGANDVLKYMGSGGKFVGGDRTVGQVEQDLHQTIQALQYAGAKVVIADLPNILEAAYFQRASVPKNTAKACAIATYFLCTLLEVGVPSVEAVPLATGVAQAYHLDTPGGCTPTSVTHPCGYLTLAGALGVLEVALVTGKAPNLDCEGANFTAPCVTGSGLGGYYITPAFAAQVQALNTTVNEGIDRSAVQNGVPLVPVTKIFDGMASGNPSNPYFRQMASINPGTCCSIAWEHGLFSNDSIHPSNTGYGLIAYYFIQAINSAYHANIPQIDLKAVYNGTRCSVTNYCYPDPYAPPYNFAPHAVRRF